MIRTLPTLPTLPTCLSSWHSQANISSEGKFEGPCSIGFGIQIMSALKCTQSSVASGDPFSGNLHDWTPVLPKVFHSFMMFHCYDVEMP